jgi:diaminopimelate epimerase
MQLHFTKMQGLGNDFVIIDAVTHPLTLTPHQICYMADRHTGIGCDQVLFVERPVNDNVDFIYRIFNANGSEVGQCGNGARCVAKFIAEKKLSHKKSITLKTMTSLLQCELNDDGNVTVNMGSPIVIGTFTIAEQTGIYLSIGNPHFVFIVNEINTVHLEKIGRICNQHPQFPEGVNVNCVQIIDKSHILLRVYERGVGETQACGSGACAAVVAGRLSSNLNHHVDVSLPGGHLFIQFDNKDGPVYMCGPAVNVFEGVIQL